MSRNGTNSNPVMVLGRAMEAFESMTGQKVNLLRFPRKASIPRSVRVMLRRLGVAIELVALAILCLGVGPCDEVRDEPKQFSKQDCEALKAKAEEQVASCKITCPDLDDVCAKECFTGDIARWIESRPNCASIPRLYYPNPSWPKVSLIVE